MMEIDLYYFNEHVGLHKFIMGERCLQQPWKVALDIPGKFFWGDAWKAVPDWLHLGTLLAYSAMIFSEWIVLVSPTGLHDLHWEGGTPHLGPSYL